MRNYLFQLVREHLGNFPESVQKEKGLRYIYCPIPKIYYERLHDEMFCHNYYLKNLCDEDRFPNWPIHEPFSVFLACINRWKDMQQRTRATSPALEGARALLRVQDGANETDLRDAFYKAIKECNLDQVSAPR